MAKQRSLDQIQANIAKKNPNLTQAQLVNRAENRFIKQNGATMPQINNPPAINTNSPVYQNLLQQYGQPANMPAQYNGPMPGQGGGGGKNKLKDPMAEGATQLFTNIGNIGGGANGDFSNILAQVGGGGGYSPINMGGIGNFSAGNISAPSLGAIREIVPETMNMDFTALRNAMGADANYAQGNALAALDNRAALAGMPGSSRHGIAQGQAIGEIQRGLDTNLANMEYNAYDSDANRRLAAQQANMQGRIATQGNQAQLGSAAMGANAQLGSAAMGANAQVQSAGIGANADLQRAAMQDATNRIGIAGDIANNQADIALRRNQMLYNALGDSYDRSIGYKALNNQAATDRYGISQNGLNTRLGMQYGLMDNQENRAMQYGMFNQNMDYMNNALLVGMLGDKNASMQYGLDYGQGMNNLTLSQLDPASQYMAMIQYYANAVNPPIILGSSSGGSMDMSRGNSFGFGFNHGMGASVGSGMGQLFGMGG